MADLSSTSVQFHIKLTQLSWGTCSVPLYKGSYKKPRNRASIQARPDVPRAEEATNQKKPALPSCARAGSKPHAAPTLAYHCRPAWRAAVTQGGKTSSDVHPRAKITSRKAAARRDLARLPTAPVNAAGVAKIQQKFTRYGGGKHAVTITRPYQ